MLDRDDELSTKASIREKAEELIENAVKGFRDQRDRSDDIMDYWDMYNCKLGEHQYYAGNSQIFIPIVRSAISARKTRFVNQIFPKSGRYVDATSSDGDIPHGIIALLESYVDKADLRTKVMPALTVNGDIEGQYNIYVDWSSQERHTATRVKTPVFVDNLPTEETVDDIEEEIILDSFPSVEVLSDVDVCVLPANSDSIDDALQRGGSVSIRRRWTKGTIKRMIADGQIRKAPGEALLTAMSNAEQKEQRDIHKQMSDAVGIRLKGKQAQVLEIWARLKVSGNMRLCRIYAGPEKSVLGVKLCPFWCDRCPLISEPQEKVAGSFKGMSKCATVAQLQYMANDMINEGADSATYSMMPIIMTDPEKNPRVGTMILDLAAVWETSPNDTRFAEFPQLWKDAFAVVAQAKTEIYQMLSVNPAMIAQGTGGKNKRNQAEIANEQQVDILTTADAVTVLEGGVLTPMIQRFAEYDHQFRDSDITVRAFGMMGERAKMEVIEPLQMGNHYLFRWYGVEMARNAQAIQQQIAFFNVIKSIPPQMYPGRKIDLTAPLEAAVENTFGPRLAPLVFQSVKEQLSVDPQLENDLMVKGFPMPVHESDDDQKHMQVHMQALETDATNNVKAHLQMHQQQMQMKQQKAQMEQQAQQQGGGGPKPGGQPQPPRQGKGPPGSIHPDQMSAAGAPGMPRKM